MLTVLRASSWGGEGGGGGGLMVTVLRVNDVCVEG